MGIILRNGFSCSRITSLSRAFSGTPVVKSKEWRMERGLPAERTANSVLIDTPDYTFLDGRPTPLLHKQKLRMLKQREYASQIVQLTSELTYAKERHQKIQQQKLEERERIIANRLKPKGETLLKKK